MGSISGPLIFGTSQNYIAIIRGYGYGTWPQICGSFGPLGSEYWGREFLSSLRTSTRRLPVWVLWHSGEGGAE